MAAVEIKTVSLAPRRRDTHKGDYGKVLMICGSEKYTGAAYFAAEAAVRTGSGLVFLSVPDSVRPVLAAKLNEPILVPRDFDGEFDAAACGCGLSLSEEALSLVKRELLKRGSPLVLDADAITLIARERLCLKKCGRPLILTPHEGEFARLVPDFSHERREEFAQNFAVKNSCVLVLKGHRTLTAAPDGSLFVNTTGNPGMAKGGSGDILSGVITSLAGQGIAPEIAAYTGVWLHGRAGDIAAEKFGEYAMTPTDMLDALKFAVKEVSQKA